MGLVYKDRVRQDCTAPATSSPFDFDVGGSTPTGYQAWDDALADAETAIYSASDSSGNWEVGVGTWTEADNALTRTTILDSSNAGSAETFSGAVTVDLSNDARGMSIATLPIVDETVTGSDIVGVVNTHHVCAIAGITTASKNITIPSGNVGDRIRVTVTDGDPDYELVIKGAASQTINGGSAATEWSRLLIAGESVQLVCVAANTWIVEVDGRIPCHCTIADRSATASHYTNNTAVVPAFDTEDIDVGGLGNLSSDRVDIRRTGNYFMSFHAQSTSTIDSNELLDLSIRVDGAYVAATRQYSIGTDRRCFGNVSFTRPVSASSNIDATVFQNSGDNMTWDASEGKAPRLSVFEVLS